MFIIVASCCPWPLLKTRWDKKRNCVKWREGKTPQQAAGTCGVSFAEEVKIWAEQTFCAGFSDTGESLFNNSPLQRISWISLWHIISTSWHFGSLDNLSSQPADHCSMKLQISPAFAQNAESQQSCWVQCDTKQLPGFWPSAELAWGCAMGMLPWLGCPCTHPASCPCILIPQWCYTARRRGGKQQICFLVVSTGNKSPCMNYGARWVHSMILLL